MTQRRDTGIIIREVDYVAPESDRRSGGMKLFCSVIGIYPAGKSLQDGFANGYYSRSRETYEFPNPADMEVDFSMQRDGTGTMSLGRRHYRVYPKPGKELSEKRLEDMTIDEFRIHLMNCLPIS